MDSSACKIEWIELPAADLKKASDFFSTVFGWAITQYSDDYWLFQSGSLHGGLAGNTPAATGGIKFSITVEDIADALKRIVEHGGVVLKEKSEIGSGFGFTAAFEDPNGNHLELWASQ